MNFDFYPLRKGDSVNLLFLIVILFYFQLLVNAGGRNTNIVLTKDTIVLNDRHKKHSNNIVIKDSKEHHHCNCHNEPHHVIVPMHYGHHEHWSHPHWHDHKRSDSALNWWDMQIAASNQHTSTSSLFNENLNHNNLERPLIKGKDNEALNHLLNQRYSVPQSTNSIQDSIKLDLGNLQRISYPVFLRQ